MSDGFDSFMRGAGGPSDRPPELYYDRDAGAWVVELDGQRHEFDTRPEAVAYRREHHQRRRELERTDAAQAEIRQRDERRARKEREARQTAQPADRPDRPGGRPRTRRPAPRGRGTAARAPRSLPAGRAPRRSPGRALYSRSGLQGTVSSWGDLAWWTAGMTIMVAILLLLLTPRGVDAFKGLTGAAAGALDLVIQPVDPLAPRVAAQAVQQGARRVLTAPPPAPPRLPSPTRRGTLTRLLSV